MLRVVAFPSPMFCTQCGNRINESERFCTKCGAPAQVANPGPGGAVATPVAAQGAVPARETRAEPPSAEPFRMFGVEAPAPESSGAGPAQPAAGTSKAIWIGIVLLLAAIAGAAWFGTRMLMGRAGSVSVRVEPATIRLRPGATATFSAFVSGDPESAVTWSVMEAPAGGIVRSTGVIAVSGRIGATAEYIAPQQPGTYHVLAKSQRDERQASSVEIVVE